MGFRLEMSRNIRRRDKKEESADAGCGTGKILIRRVAMELIRLKVNSQYRPCVDEAPYFSWVITSDERM